MRARRQNSGGELTYEQVEARKDRGVEGLVRLGMPDQAADLESESVEDFAERKKITIVNPRRRANRKNAGAGQTVDFHGAFREKRDAVAKEHQRGGFIKGRHVGPGDYRYVVMTKKNYVPNRGDWARTPHGTVGKVLEIQGGPRRRRYRLDVPGMGPVWVRGPLYPAKPNGRRNPDTVEDAAAMYEKFHGKKPTSVKEISILQRDVHNLSGLGTLLFLRTELSQELYGKDYAFCFAEEDGIVAACDPEGVQLYFVGGRQDLTRLLREADVDVSKELIDLGECDYICYVTQKDFDNFQTIEYQHNFGEESGILPRLIFNRPEKQMYLVGGDYEVKREGIVN